MYAVIKSGGKQYRVSPGERVRLESLPGQEKEKIDFSHVLMVGGADTETILGCPVLDNVKVTATVLRQGKEKKLIVFKKKRRKDSAKKQGHRQQFTEVVIDEIVFDGQKTEAPSIETTQSEPIQTEDTVEEKTQENISE